MKLSVAMLMGVALFAVLLVFAMLHVKNDVQTLVHERTALVNDQRQMKEDLKVLEAEYAHLTRPARLWQFAEGLNFRETEPFQLAGGPVKPEILEFVRRVSLP